MEFDKLGKNFSKKNQGDEGYLLSVINFKKGEAFNVVIRTRKELADIMTEMPEQYVVLDIQRLTNVKLCADVMREILDDNKPEDMNYGNN